MLVSIIIPCYNSEKYLENTVQSLLNQSYKELEIILVNDGSKDNTENIIKKLASKDKRIKYLKQENKGVSAARNLALDNSKGEFIAFLDSDDTYEKDKIMYQVKKLQETGANVCYCGNNYIFKDKIIPHIYNNSGKILNEYIVDKLMIHLNDWMIKSTLIQENKIRFPEKFRFGEDSNFFMKILALSEVVAVDRQLTNYYIRETSSSFNNTIRGNSEENYISEFKSFLKETKNLIYDKEDVKRVLENLDRFLLPQVIIRNIIYCNRRRSELTTFEKDTLRGFKINFLNIKSSVKFCILYIKLYLKG